MNGYAISNPYGAQGYAVPPEKNNTGIRPALGNQHQWVATAIYSVSQTAVDAQVARWAAGSGAGEGIELDHENLTTIQGPVCLKCHQQLTPETHARPCPVRVIPIIGFRM